MVTDSQTIEAIYRMNHEQKLSGREIARQLHVTRRTIKKYLENFPAVAILGPRQCGKSTLASHLLKDYPEAKCRLLVL